MTKQEAIQKLNAARFTIDQVLRFAPLAAGNTKEFTGLDKETKAKLIALIKSL